MKIDLRKEFKQYYSSSLVPNIIEVPEAKFLTIIGRGEPEGEAYQNAMNALYSVAYTIKFQSKANGKDYTVMGLEGLWWLDKTNKTFQEVPREEWNWKSMIRQPDFISDKIFIESKNQAKEKKGILEIDNLNLENFHEGLSAQIMHIGPYSEEDRTIRILYNFIKENGYDMRGNHHEIYLSDPRRVKPEKCKTIIRQPIEKNRL